jgi:hypothetical protein
MRMRTGKLQLRLSSLDARLCEIGERLRTRTESITATHECVGFEAALLNDAQIATTVRECVDALPTTADTTDAGDATLSIRLLTESAVSVRKLITRIVRLTSDVLLAPCVHILSPLPRLTHVWQAGAVGQATVVDLPAFAVTPMEYVTKVYTRVCVQAN